MARIRLRHCTLRFIDGYAAEAVINDTPANGDTTLTITFAGGEIPVGTRFEIAGVNQIYTITAVSGTPNTTDITFTPALATADNIPSDGATITIQGRCLEVKVGDGNISYDTDRELEYELDRGQLDAVVEGDDVPVSLNLDLTYEWLKAATGVTIPTPKEVLRKKGAAADWVSAGADPCEPYAILVEMDYHPQCNLPHEITRFPEFRVESLSHDLQNSTIAARGRCKVSDITPIRRAY